jgi:ABC-type cobalamin/Fe3+-siderophores transport system ATPase subunit
MIRAKGLCAGYSGHDVLHDVSFEIEPGSLTGLVGPNGSGKTTLIRVLGGLIRPSVGSLIMGEAPVVRRGAAELARLIAVVPQTPVLPAGFSAGEVVLMGRTPYLRLWEMESSHDLELARMAMSEVGVLELADRPVEELSGGEAQRVVIARALAQQAPLMLLDEPTAHLDIGHQAATFGLARGLAHDQGKTILAVAHDITLASAFCERLLVMSAGRIVADGAPIDVISGDLIEAVYGTPVRVIHDPDNGRPIVLSGASA